MILNILTYVYLLIFLVFILVRLDTYTLKKKIKNNLLAQDFFK